MPLKTSLPYFFMEVGQSLQFGSLQHLWVPSTQFLCFPKSWSSWGSDILDGLSIVTFSSSHAGKNWQKTLKC
nr:hypothetical protein Iba_scaffold262CG0530 [Ipomoea batatas]